jgi:NADPH:quinone reductase-like Zn-dependent oxidoreductase
MRVARFFPPGGPEKLMIEDEPIPTIAADEVLIEVFGIGIVWSELTWPIYQNPDGTYITHIPGHDFAGVVREVGSGIFSDDIDVGSEVIAFTSKRDNEGGLAGYAKAHLDEVVLAPKSLDLVEAASVPLSALTAWQALFDHGKLEKGQKLLVTGAAGGTGVWAVQFGKMAEATVVGTASSERSFEIVESLGIDQVIDYKTHQLDEVVQDVDVILDTVGGETMQQCLKVLKKDGTYISITNPNAAEQAATMDRKGLFFIWSANTEQMRKIVGLIDDGKLKVFVDSVFEFDDVRKAFETGAAGHVHGKIVVKGPGK